MKDLNISLDDYNIVVSEDLEGLNTWLSEQQYSSYLVLIDENTKQHCLPAFEKACAIRFRPILIKSGEAFKNLATCEAIWSELLDSHTDRNALMINLGGGVIGDMGGFAASCYKRGISFMNIPTTVLSQVDASIGGKLGIDYKFAKNLIGLFGNPKRVHISTLFHNSLSDRQYNNGFAEIFKHALIESPEQWEYYKGVKSLRSAGSIKNLQRSLMIKKRIVEQDPFEKGIRKALNFGHTIGHAIEALSIEKGEEELLHGEAVAIGMVLEAYLSHYKLGLEISVVHDIADLVFRHYQPYHLDSGTEDDLWRYMAFDKKNVKDKVMAVLIESVGRPVLDIELHKEDLSLAIDYYNSQKA
ncbi:MAG: 3-dehydroquinate synthase [Bacteroidetes bacterium]|nr:3-dehydroquinate synthase [Bacteroidota bacterium]